MPLDHLVPILRVSIGPVILFSGIGLLILSMTNRFGRIIEPTRLLPREPRQRPARHQRGAHGHPTRGWAEVLERGLGGRTGAVPVPWVRAGGRGDSGLCVTPRAGVVNAVLPCLESVARNGHDLSVLEFPPLPLVRAVLVEFPAIGRRRQGFRHFFQRRRPRAGDS